MPILSCAPVPLQILLQRIENPPALQKKEWNSGTHVPGAQSSKRLLTTPRHEVTNIEPMGEGILTSKYD